MYYDDNFDGYTLRETYRYKSGTVTRSYFEDVLDDGVKVTSGRSRREDEG